MKKTKGTDAIFANLQTLREEACGDPETLEIPMDTQANVQTGDDALGRKRGQAPFLSMYFPNHHRLKYSTLARKSTSIVSTVIPFGDGIG